MGAPAGYNVQGQMDANARQKQIVNDEKATKEAGNQQEAEMGLPARYGQAAADRYAQLLNRGSTLDAQEFLSGQMANQFMSERDKPAYIPQQIGASTAAYHDPGSVATYDYKDPGFANTYQATTIDKPRDVQVGALNSVDRVDSTNVAGPGTATIAGMERVQGQNLDTSQADQVRGSQDRYLKALESRSKGEAPSVAEESYKSKQADVVRNAMGIAGQARGSDRAYARLHAMDAIAENTRRAGFESAQLRAQEMGQASEQLGGALSGVRGTDIGQATTAAQLRQEAALANQRTTSSTEQYNAGAVNDMNKYNTQVAQANAERAQQASAANAAAGNARTMDEAQLRANVATGNVTRDMGGQEFNAGAQNTAAATNTAAQNARQSERAAGNTAVSAANTAAINARGSERAAGQNKLGEFNATQTQAAAGANQAAGLQGNAQEINRQEGLAGNAIQSQGQAVSGETAENTKPKGPSTGDRILGAVTTLGAGALAAKSDERVKEDVSNVPDAAVERLASALKAKQFAYKGKYDDGEDHAGFMAQDLEKDPLGKKFVSKDPEGVREVNYGQLASMLLAAAIRGKKEART